MKTLLIAICITTVAAGFWLFNPLTLYFLNDDFIHIPLSKAGIIFQRNFFRPVCDLSIRLDYLLWERKAWGYHITNLILHIANTLLVGILSFYLFKKYTDFTTKSVHIFVAVLFFVYPFHSESIFWIIGRSGSLGSLFCISGILFYIKRQNQYYFVCSLLLFVVGLFTYESVWAFPFIAIGLSWLDIKIKFTTLKKERKYNLLTFSIFFAFLVIRLISLGEIFGEYEASAFKELKLDQLILNLIRLIVRSFTPPADTMIILYINTFILLSIIVFLCFRINRKKERFFIFFLIFCFVVSLVPYTSLGIDTHGVEGERFLYLPSVFTCMLIITCVSTCFTTVKMQRLSISVIFLSAVFFLMKANNYYVTASNISKTTIDQINALEGKKRIIIDSLPQEMTGAVIFRSGFYEAINWINKPGTKMDIVLLSIKKENNNWVKNYSAIYNTISPITKIDSVLQYTLQETYLKIKVDSIQYNPSTDAYFLFSNKGLEIIK